jgi:hypothetical protein
MDQALKRFGKRKIIPAVKNSPAAITISPSQKIKII